MKGDVWLRRAVTVESPAHLLDLGTGHTVLPAFCLGGRDQQGLLGRDCGGGQVWRTYLLCHQLFLDFIDQD